MADIRILLENVRKNLPPLNKPTRQPEGEIILVNVAKKTSFGKLVQRKNNDKEEPNRKKAESWLHIKEKMILEIEHKRSIEWEQQKLKNKLENEEDEPSGQPGDEEVDILSQSSNDQNAEEISSQLSEDDQGDKDEVPINDENEENSEKIQENNSESDEEDLFCSRRKTKIIMDDEDDKDPVSEVDDIDENESKFDMNEHVDDGETSLDGADKFFVSQNCLPGSPILTPQIEKPEDKQEVYDSQMLLDLCSGRFNNDNLTDDHQQSEVEEESDEERPETNFKVSDFIADEAELSSEDENNISSDEDDDEEEDQGAIHDLIDDDIEETDGLREQVEKIHNKNMLDEDKRQMMILKEFFFEDADLQDGTKERQKKFKWDLNQDDVDLTDLVNTLSDSDSNSSDDDSSDQDDEKPRKAITLKRSIEQVDCETNEPNEESQGEKRFKALLDSRKFVMNQLSRKKKNQSSMSSFVIRDERFQKILNSTRMNSDSSKKKAKNNNSISIFEVLDS